MIINFIFMIINLILWCVFSITFFQSAYKIKTKEDYRETYLKNVTVRDDGEIVTFLRNYRSKEGYLKYIYMRSLLLGTFGAAYALIRYTPLAKISYFLLIFLVIFVLADFGIYKKYNTI